MIAEQPQNQPQVREPERFSGHKIRLEIFEGPLDLLLYLVRAHKYDICDIPIREITGQFVEYLTLMNEVEADYAGDFLVTAATLMQIKARMLLPRYESQNEDALEGDEDTDPRTELVERLIEYQRIQEAADELRERREERADLFSRSPQNIKFGAKFDAQTSESLVLAEVSSFDLLSALKRVLNRFEERPVALIKRETFTLPDRIRALTLRLSHLRQATFEKLCDDCESRLEVVVTFLAVLELIRRGKAVVRQSEIFGEIRVEVVV